MKKWRNIIAGGLITALFVFSLSGCAGKETESGSQENAADNVIITETGETLVQEQLKHRVISRRRTWCRRKCHRSRSRSR